MHQNTAKFLVSTSGVAMFGLAFFAITPKTYAVCQVICPIVVVGTLSLLERFGIDNTISGLWIGGLLMLSSLITIQWIAKWKKHWSINIAVLAAFYVSTVLPLITKHIIGDPLKTLWGMDKTALGLVIGSIFFFLGDYAYERIKANNGGKAWFPFQKALMPVLPLILFSAIFHFIVKYSQ
jgi:uncharacterized membrane protein YGL010W